MSLSWSTRKARLGCLLRSRGDELEDGLALDRLLHGQSVIGKTSKTMELDALRFQDSDLQAMGRLACGQFGVIDVVKCHLDGRVFVRKSIEKRIALRNRDQCFPQIERDILLRATQDGSPWAPHLLCAFHTPTHLNLIMDYAEGGTLWDVLESSPNDGKVPESDLLWWTPQFISAIHWCHSQGFAHRDIKPHNFVLSAGARVLLIDFGSAAPLFPPRPDGSRALPKRYCLIPCGTCDYISPEILRAHEEALVALEMEHEEEASGAQETSEYDMEGYGLETDWWSLGAMLYEMAYGVTPFFAKDIRQTYLKIMDYQHSLRFNGSVAISPKYRDLLSRLLTSHEQRIGRRSVKELTEHSFFSGVDWQSLPHHTAPLGLHLPQFVNGEPPNVPLVHSRSHGDDSHSQPFVFSALFQSSPASSPGLSALHCTPSQKLNRSLPQGDAPSSFIGFSWGPILEAFPDSNENHEQDQNAPQVVLNTPSPIRFPSIQTTLHPFSGANITPCQFTTPIRANTWTPHQTMPRTSTSRRTVPRRSVSDREAMKQLVDCVGMSARKKVLESGRKPRLLTSFNRSRVVKELRFLPFVDTINPDKNPVHGPLISPSSSSENTDTEVPPSPSPSPRPGSAMSMISRRSGTPTITTITGSYSQRTIPENKLISCPAPPKPLLNTRSDCLPDWKEEVTQTEARCENEIRLSELEEKHALLMQDIFDIEQRLCNFSMLVSEDVP